MFYVEMMKVTVDGIIFFAAICSGNLFFFKSRISLLPLISHSLRPKGLHSESFLAKPIDANADKK